MNTLVKIDPNWFDRLLCWLLDIDLIEGYEAYKIQETIVKG